MRPVYSILLVVFTFNSFAQSCSPTWQEIFDFKVGSVYQYQATSGCYGGGYASRFARWTIKNKWETNDTIFYELHGYGRSAGCHSNGGPHYELSDTVYFTGNWYQRMNDCDSMFPMKFHIYQRFEEGVYNQDALEEYRNLGYMFYSPYTELYLDMRKDSLKGTVSIGNFDNWDYPWFYPNDSGRLQRLDRRDLDQAPEVFLMEFEKGLGLTRIDELFFEGSYFLELEGYIIDGIQTGTVYTDEQILSINPIPERKEPILYPNSIPQGGSIRLNGDVQVYGIHRIDGTLVEFISEERQLFIRNAVPGVYLIIGETANGFIFRERIIVN